MKRHLRTQYEMTPDQHRARWNLPSDYPMVALNYAAVRSQLAKQMGSGNNGDAADPPNHRRRFEHPYSAPRGNPQSNEF